MIIINLSCSGYMIEINGEQISIVGLNTRYRKVRRQCTLIAYDRYISVSALIKICNGLTVGLRIQGILKAEKQKNILMRNRRTKKQNVVCVQCCIIQLDAFYIHALNFHHHSSFPKIFFFFLKSDLQTDCLIPVKDVQLNPQINKINPNSPSLSQAPLVSIGQLMLWHSQSQVAY